MATSAKSQKEKPHGAPRLAPRPTAASAARAARNATNRNLALLQPSSNRHSPTRATAPPSVSKAKNSAIQRNSQKADSKTDVRKSSILEKELTNSESVTVTVAPLKCDSESFVVDVTNVPAEEIQETCGQESEVIEYTNEQENVESIENDHCEIEVLEDIFIDESTSQVPEIITISRPQTPAKSRPQTPSGGQQSRPQTPLKSSRPSTPALPQRPAPPTPGSRPTTPHHPGRPTTPTPVAPLPPTKALAPPISPSGQAGPVNNDNDIQSAFNTKQRQFHRMKKELDLKQQAILEVFECLRELNERMASEGMTGSGEGLQIQELVVFNVGDWTSEEVAQLCRDAVASSGCESAVELINTTMNIDEHALAELDANVTKVPSCFADLCIQAFTARQELIDWVKELIGKHDDGCGESIDRISRYNAQGLELCETLRELKSRADDAVDTVTQLSRRACRERGALVAVGESLVREIARLRQDLEAHAVIVNEMREIRAENETAKALEDTRRELDEERSARVLSKDKLTLAESQLRQSRVRVNKMDRQLREAEATIASLTGTVKSLEDQSRQREVQLEARARKLKESLKTGEVASNLLTQQRDALQAELQSLKEQIDTLTAQHKSTVHELNKEIKELKALLEEQRQLKQKEIELRKSTESKLVELQNNIEELKTKNAELESSRPNPELPTEREMDLWAELQATKEALSMTEEEVNTCKREKVRFLETLTKISESENKVGMQQKLAAELLSKEEVVGKMQIQIRELTKNIKLNEQKVIQYEQYVRDLQAHSRAVANCQEAPDGISYQDLQQEIMNLRMGLLDAVHRNDELTEILAQRERQLEHQDKTSRDQARVIKVREELINMLKNKETEQSRELAALQQDIEHRMRIVDQVNKQIAAKAEEIQELFATLENKQQQIHRLEKIVLALEEQQRRAQAQRTRHEEKIAALEHELAAGNRRERKFIFF